MTADRGLFLTGVDVERLDRVELGPGAPPGTPVSAWVDAERRAWLATEGPSA